MRDVDFSTLLEDIKIHQLLVPDGESTIDYPEFDEYTSPSSPTPFCGREWVNLYPEDFEVANILITFDQTSSSLLESSVNFSS